MGSISLDEARDLGQRALMRHKVSSENAAVTIDALLRAEMQGIPSHGFSRIPYYAGQAATGKIDGFAKPQISRPRPGAILTDARCGFAFRAMADSLPVAAQAARENGIALLAIKNSHHAGVLGLPVADFAEQGLLTMAFANSPAALAPYGGSKAVFGTNPMAMGCPRRNAPPLVIDMSMGVMARGKVLQAAEKGELLPEGVAVDAEGKPTRDAAKAFAGSLLPFGGPKGYALALMVEIMAAVLPGAALAVEASSLFAPEGPSPRIGQSFLVMDPVATAGDGFTDRIDALLRVITEQEGVRLPGDRRLSLEASARAKESVALPDPLLEQLYGLCKE